MDKALELLNKEYQKIMGHTRQARYRYWKSEKGDWYGWTTEKMNHKGNPRYVAFIYRHLKSRKAMKLVRKSGFAKRKDAKARALKWFTSKV